MFAVELPIDPIEARATMPKISVRKPVFEPTPRDDDYDSTHRQSRLSHSRLSRLSELTADIPVYARKYAIPAGIVVMVCIGVGAAISMSRHHGPEKKAIDIAAAFTPPKIEVAPPKPEPLPAPTRPARLVEVRLESTPPGASATLLDTSNGNSTPLGTTPVDASIDPSKNYDVRFELEGRPSQTDHLDPTQNHITVALADPDPAPAVVVAAPVVKDKHHRRHGASAKKALAKRVATAPAVRASHAAAQTASTAPEDKVAALASLGPSKDPKKTEAPGKLAVTTSVPCAILLDGANTGKTSPATLSVPAGHHSIRLIAATQHINKQVGVDITAKKTTRLDQTF